MEEADIFLIFRPDEIQKFIIKLKKDNKTIDPPLGYKIFYFKSTNPRDASLASLGFINKTVML